MSACGGAAFKRTPAITREGMQTILEEIAKSRPLPAGITPQRFIDARVFCEQARAVLLMEFIGDSERIENIRM